MGDAAAEYAEHRKGEDSWALGRFVVPFPRWNDLMASFESVASTDESWPVSLLASAYDSDRICELAEHSTELRVESVETKATTIADLVGVQPMVERGLSVFVEPTRLSEFEELVTGLKRVGAAAKIRTGGITADAFPTAEQILSFLKTCRRAGLRFKATAGLHHAVRGEYRLTYETSPSVGEMFGFLNVAFAAALLLSGRPDSVVMSALLERAADAFEFTNDGARWRNNWLTSAELDAAHNEFFLGFGSCSFREPMADIGLGTARSE
jgi:hypothetical protein